MRDGVGSYCEVYYQELFPGSKGILNAVYSGFSPCPESVSETPKSKMASTQSGDKRSVSPPAGKIK